MADSSTKKTRTEEYGVRTVKGRWSEWSVDGSGITCETREQTSGLSTEDLAWLMEPFASAEQTGREAATVEWVRCGERMPPTGLTVLIQGGAGYFDGQVWRSMVAGCLHRPLEWEPLHWMYLPLPAPPKGEAAK